MEQNNSIKEYYIKLEKMMSNVVNMMTALNTALSSSSSEIEISLVNTDNSDDATSSVRIPSFLYLENKLEKLDNVISNLFKIPKSGEAWFESSSNMYKLSLLKSNNAPVQPIVSNLDQIGFNIKDNNIFKDLVNPKTYIRLNLGNISDNINQILVKKIIINRASDTDYLKEFNSYSDIKSALFNRTIGVDYEEYDTVVDIPIKSDKYDSFFKIEQVTNNGDGIYELHLDTLTYYDKDDKSIQYTIRKGTLLCIGDEYVTYEVIDVNTIYNSKNDNDNNEYVIIVKERIGHINIQTYYENSEMYLKIYNGSYSEFHYVDVPLEENPNIILFISTIYNNVRSTYSNAIHLDLSTIYMKDQNNNYILDESGNKISYIEYYNAYCKNIGDMMVGFTKLSYPQVSNYTNAELRRLTDSDELKEIVTTTLYSNSELVLNVSRINTHLIDDETSKDIINLHTQKNELNSQLRSVQDNVDQIYTQLTTTDFSQESSITQESLRSKLNEYYNERLNLEKQLLSIVDSINLAKSGVIGLNQSKYRIRGVTDANDKNDSAIESPIISFLHNNFGYNCDIIGLDIEYKYKTANKDSNTILNNNSTIFTDWNHQSNIERERYLEFDPNTNKYKISFSNYNALSNVVKWNQIDIPINQGEDVVIRIRYKYNIGQPFINLYSPWSNEITVAFPTELTESTEISSILDSNDDDVVSAKFIKALINDGYEEHVTNKIVDNSQVFYHMPENIYSGFNTAENHLISLKDKLIDMNNEITSYKASIDNELNSNYEVILEWDNTSIQLSNMTNNNIVINELINGVFDTFIKKKMNLIIKNTGSTPIKLYSIFPGNIDTTLLDSSNKYFDDIIINYERVPLLVEGSNVPSESILPQYMGQWIYFRQNNPFTSYPLYYNDSNQNEADIEQVSQGYKPKYNGQLSKYINIENKQALLPYRNRGNIINSTNYWGYLSYDSNLKKATYKIGSVESSDSLYASIKDLYLYENCDNTNNEYLLKYEHIYNSVNNTYLNDTTSISDFVNKISKSLRMFDGAFLIPELISRTQILCDSKESNQYKLLDVGKMVSIPILFEYFLENSDNTNVSITKTLAFDLKTSLMREPDHYILSVTAKYDYSQTNASSQSYSNIIDGINS